MPASAHLPTAMARARTPPKFRIVDGDGRLPRGGEAAIPSHSPEQTRRHADALGGLARAARLRAGQRRAGFDRQPARSRNQRARPDREKSGEPPRASSGARWSGAGSRRNISRSCTAGRSGKRRRVDAPLARQGEHGPSAIWLKQTIHEKGAPARRIFGSRSDSLGKGDRVKFADRARDSAHRPHASDSRAPRASRPPDCRRQNLRP